MTTREMKTMAEPSELESRPGFRPAVRALDEVLANYDAEVLAAMRIALVEWVARH